MIIRRLARRHHYTATSPVDKPLLLYKTVASLSPLSLELADIRSVAHVPAAADEDDDVVATDAEPLATGTSGCAATCEDDSGTSPSLTRQYSLEVELNADVCPRLA